MRVPLSWLGEYVDLPEGTTPEDVHAALVRVGLEEEDIHRFEVAGPVVVGRVVSFVEEPQSNGKTIRWCQVDVGEPEPRGIVCGARNFFEGDKVVVTLPGAVLPGPFPIAARKTYGHVSDGMIASAKELGLGDEHSGILRLVELGLDPEPGTDAIALLGLADSAVEVNVTPDRGYAFSIRGIAREFSHSTGSDFRDPALAVDPTEHADGGFPVAIDDSSPVRGRVGASVFVARAVRGIDPTRPTPPWMVARLTLAGIRSISLVVDITNYVMLELGQPIHAYDLDRLTGGIVVRRAQPGETLVTLDDQTRSLHPEDLLITDGSGPIGLAGVMGGASTEIGDGTTNVLIEAANFDPTSIARTARRHKLPSEAQKRFARGVDPRVATRAATRVAQLIVELAGGTADGTGTVLDDAPAPAPIALSSGFASRLVGVEYTDAEVADALTAIGASVEAGDPLTVVPPSWRPDLVDAPSLAEEVARIVGFDRIPSVLPVAPPGRGLTLDQRRRRTIADALAGAGFTEVLSYPFFSQATLDAFEGRRVPTMGLANALDSEAARMRTTLLPGLVEVARRNLSRGLTDLAIFEVGTVFLPQDGVRYGTDSVPIGNRKPDEATLAELEASLPAQPRRAGVLVLGNAVERQPGQAAVTSGLVDVLDAARIIAAAVGATLSPVQSAHPALHPGRTAELRVGDVVVGFAGELLPSLAAELDLPRVVGVLELDLDTLFSVAPAEVASWPLSGYPAATQDLSVVVPAEVPAGDVLAAVVEGAGALLEHAALVDDYRGTGVPEGSKSITLALRFRAPDRTLTAAEATEAKLAGLAVATERLGATLRE